MASARAEAFDWIAKLRTAPDDAGLKASLERWRDSSEENRAAFASVEHMLRVASELPPGFAATGRQSGRIGRQRMGFGFLRSRPVLAAGSLAVLVGIAVAVVLPGVFGTMPQLPILHSTTVAETRQIDLDDGSTLFLDAETRLRLVMTDTAREVELLSGQAYFDVAADRGRPFVVTASGLTVTVTGTRFAVSSRGERVVVAVESGSVDAAYGSDRSRLTAGDRLGLHRTTRALVRTTVDPAGIGAFRGGRLMVESLPMGELIAVLDAYYAGDIWLGDPGLAERPVSGSFDLAAPLVALSAAAGTQNATVRSMGGADVAVFAR